MFSVCVWVCAWWCVLQCQLSHIARRMLRAIWTHLCKYDRDRGRVERILLLSSVFQPLQLWCVASGSVPSPCGPLQIRTSRLSSAFSGISVHPCTRLPCFCLLWPSTSPLLLLCLTSCQNYSTSPLTIGPFIHPFIKSTTHPPVYPLAHPDNPHLPSHPSFIYSFIIHLCINPYIYSPIHCTYSFIHLSIHPSIFHPSIHHLMHTLYIYLQYSFTHRLVTHPSIFVTKN